LLIVALVVAAVIGIVLVLRRSADETPPRVTSAPVPSTTASGTPTVDLATARKQLSLFVHEADAAHTTDLVDAAGQLETALSKDDCIAARKPYDVIKERKVDLTTHTTLVLSQIRMLTSVAAYCNVWTSESGKRW